MNTPQTAIVVDRLRKLNPSAPAEYFADIENALSNIETRLAALEAGAKSAAPATSAAPVRAAAPAAKPASASA